MSHPQIYMALNSFPCFHPKIFNSDKIGLHNIKHWSKFLIWKEFGFCPTRTHIEERLAVLNNKLQFEELLELSEERKKLGSI